jgi:hypothetical protein
MNVPVGIAGIILVTLFIEDVREENVRPFDWKGFFLSGIGLAGTLFGMDTVIAKNSFDPITLCAFFGGLLTLTLYVLHARRADHPILDLKLLKIPTFRGSVTGGSIFRLGIGANPFLLPLMLQEGFGYTPFHSGIVTCASAAGAFGMRTVARRVLRKFGFRRVLLWNSLVASAFLACCGLFQPATPQLVMMAVIFLGGLFRSLEFTALSAIAFADVEPRLMSHATSFQQMAQRLSMSFGVALSAFFLHQLSSDPAQVPVSAFQISFVLIGLISATSVWTFARLAPDAGAVLAGRAQVERARSRAYHA